VFTEENGDGLDEYVSNGQVLNKHAKTGTLSLVWKPVSGCSMLVAVCIQLYRILNITGCGPSGLHIY
jgi:hypothetical protein